MPVPSVVRSLPDLRWHCQLWRQKGESVALVPTMGSLHRGHLSLVERAGELCRRVCVSIFVNPAQFGEGEDYEDYPRDEEADTAALAGKCDLLYLPTLEQIYPPGFALSLCLTGHLTQELCGQTRPIHFNGVALVVTKLLLQVAPAVAIFGEKDYQQLIVIRRLVSDLDLPVEIVGAPIIRESDGLALSSRNAYLSAKERLHAPVLYQSLRQAADEISTGKRPISDVLAEARTRLLQDGGFDAVDYVELRDAATLLPVADLENPARLLAAARLGRARLIDNVAVMPSKPATDAGRASSG